VPDPDRAEYPRGEFIRVLLNEKLSHYDSAGSARMWTFPQAEPAAQPGSRIRAYLAAVLKKLPANPKGIRWRLAHRRNRRRQTPPAPDSHSAIR